MKVQWMFTILLSLFLIACGGDEKKKNGVTGVSVDPLAPSTMDGLLSQNGQTFEYGGAIYRVQTGQGFQNPQMNPASQVNENGVLKYRMRLVGYIYSQCQTLLNQINQAQYNPTYQQQLQHQYQQCLNTQQTQNQGQQTLIVTSAQYI